MAALIFRYQDDDNFYYFLVNDTGSHRIGKKQDGRWRSVADTGWVYSPRVTPDGYLNRLRVVCRGDQIATYANGEHLATLTDDAFSDGMVGVTVHSSRGSGVVVGVFDEFVVTRAP